MLLLPHWWEDMLPLGGREIRILGALVSSGNDRKGIWVDVVNISF